MPNDLTLTTRGLPTPGGPTWVGRTFQWIFAGDTLTIPKYQCGQTDFCAQDSEQGSWLDGRGAAWLHGVWHCVWEWNTPGARDEFMAILAPLDPSHDEVARAMRTLDGANAADRAQAARTLLALSQPNLAAALPAIEQVLRDPDPELRGLAAALIYRWHRRVESTRLAPLFRDDDPVVRRAALLQAQREFNVDPYARERLPLVLEGMTDGESAVRHQALQALEAAALKGLVTSRRVLELRADVGPLLDGNGHDRSDALAKLADSRGPRTPSAPAMAAFYAALCEVERLRAKVERRPGDDRELRLATDRTRERWERLPLDAPDEVRLYDTRVDVLLSAGSSARPNADLARRIARSRSPRRELDAAAIYWVHQHTAPKGLPADLVPLATDSAQREAGDLDADDPDEWVPQHLR